MPLLMYEADLKKESKKQALLENFPLDSDELAPPQLPPDIPPQKLPSVIRWFIKLLILPFIALDTLLQKILRIFIPPPYRKEGSCLKRGKCCHYILMDHTPLSHRFPFLEKLFKFWFTEVHGFYERGFQSINEANVVSSVFSCRYLQKDHTCKHYFFRPTVCRNWPRIEYFDRPKILKGCGYKAVVTKKYQKWFSEVEKAQRFVLQEEEK